MFWNYDDSQPRLTEAGRAFFAFLAFVSSFFR